MIGVRAFVAAGGDPAGLRFRMRNAVPFARGLGSSAATIAAGLAAADAWNDRPPRDLLGLAAEIEGHPDNVAAALNGGLTLAWAGVDGPAAIGFGVPEAGFVVVVPEQRLSTAEARGLLPAQVPHADAVHTAARAALLVAALGSGDQELLREALDDRLHEPTAPRWCRCSLPSARRWQAMTPRWASRCRARVRACWSGAGPDPRPQWRMACPASAARRRAPSTWLSRASAG